jgi:hypothetical protein
MAIDRIPGVGPANSDIAAAVAAPSAATIAAAVAAPSAATIAAAVAAPSSATIATAVAAAVPTIGAINTSVANNASPFGGTWALISETAFNNAQNITVSGLSSYKYLHFTLSCYNTNTNDINVRFNGSSSSVYQYIIYDETSGQTGQRAVDASSFPMAQYGQQADSTFQAFFEIQGAQSASHKIFKGISQYALGSGATCMQLTDGLFRSTSGISSVTIATSRTNNSGVLRIQGAN